MIRTSQDEIDGFAAVYREALGLAAVAVVVGVDGPRIIAVAGGEAETAEASDNDGMRWWCRATDTGRIIAAARGRLRRSGSSCDRQAPSSAATRFAQACGCVQAAAGRLNIVLQSDAEIRADVMQLVARIDAELGALQQHGGLKPVNRAYRQYRLETSGRGERALRYDEWMRKYRENLVRQAAAALRAI